MAEWSIAAVLKTVEPRGSGGSNPSLSANQNPWWRQRTCPLPFSFEASPTSQQTGAGPPAAAQGKTSEATSTPKTPPRQKSSDIIPTISRDICALAHVPRTLTVSLPERRIRSWQGLRSETRRSRKRRPLILRKIPKRRYRSQENKKSDKDQWNLIFNYLQMIQALLSNNPNVRHFVAPPSACFRKTVQKRDCRFCNLLILRAVDEAWTRDLFLTKEVLYHWATTAIRLSARCVISRMRHSCQAFNKGFFQMQICCF